MNILLKGDFGNQLFVYTAYNKIKKINKINCSKKFYQFSKFMWSKKGKYLDISSISHNNILSINLPRILEEIIYFFKFYIFNNVIRDNSQLRVLNKKRITLNGYFQNKKWYENEWKNTVNFVIKSFRNRNKIKKYPIIISLAMGKSNKETKRRIKFEYYLKGLKFLNIKKKDTIFIAGVYTKRLLADFIFYLKKNDYKKIIILDYNKKINSYDKSILDFMVISKSKKLIMSNSTFCWWASVSRTFFNLKTKNVVAPRIWREKRQGNFGNPGTPKNFQWKFINNKIF